MQAQVLYYNQRRFTLYAVSLLTFLVAAFTNYMIYSNWHGLLHEFGSQASAVVWITFMIVMGNAMLAAMVWLSGKYVLRVDQLDEQTIAVKVWTIYGLPYDRSYPASILAKSKSYQGRSSHIGAPTVSAPYTIIRTAKGKKLIIDDAGVFPQGGLHKPYNPKKPYKK